MLTIKALSYTNLNLYSLEVVSRYRDPQLQVGEITHISLIWWNIDV